MRIVRRDSWAAFSLSGMGAERQFICICVGCIKRMGGKEGGFGLQLGPMSLEDSPLKFVH